ncbi:ShlB/FhaC/HecB family hemolysin secretion/activation protein [Nitrospirillum amazonense]|uniref:ShlB/FhaC/HecB family hemolysin secretion/activation protein n=1 Tax=Nitrospirillum amazonense TaxID=28077 RepID=UPI0024123089|nr:ShlB/FhaC/HecB family hemolysin secretion/activation protein [Nitrospirillum amazonense]MDG3444557.1 ShlB/FhaC/HecB family hemolysin secretion/activation protein [Nitrospirillum amazonense]
MCIRSLLLFTTILTGAAVAHAADIPPSPENITKTDNDTAPPALVPVLKGMRFSASTDCVNEPVIQPLEIDQGLDVLQDPKFKGVVESYLGRPTTMADIQQISQAVTTAYRNRGAPFMRVTTPPQDITDGAIRFIITPFRLGHIAVAGNQWFSDETLVSECDLKPGQVLLLADVNADLERLNANPFRQVEAHFSPGTDPGTTDLTLQTKDRFPIKVFASYDNAGAPSVGQTEWATGITWGNVAGLDAQASYQYMKSDSGRFEGHSATLSAPLPWHDQIQLQGAYSVQTPSSDTILGIQGVSGQASLRYIHAFGLLHLTANTTFSQSLQFGYDFKTTNNNIEFGGFRIFATQVEVDQFPLTYDAVLADKWGQFAFENSLFLSPGGLTSNNNAAAFRALLPDARDTYFYDRMSLTRTTFFGGDFSLTSRLIAQMSPHNLMYTEQLGIGGVNSVRGYFSNTATGSTGFLASNELRAPPASLLKLLWPESPVLDQIQAGIFWDYGYGRQVTPIPDATNEAVLSSIGLDLHMVADRYIDVKFDIGWRLRRPPQNDTRGAFADFSVTASF